jgi:choline-sulfatase
VTDLNKPNVLIIMSDEHNPRFTGCYGHPVVRTPNLDRLAGEGVQFDNAYCNSPMCGPSRMSFLTGMYAHRISAWDNGSVVKSEIPTFANYFEAAGYDTTLCGRMHMIGGNRLHGFGSRLYEDMEDWMSTSQLANRTPEARRGSNSHVTECGPGTGSWQEYDRHVADLSKRFVETKAAAQEDSPWLLVSGFMFPHFPLIAPEQFYSMYDPEQIELPELEGETLESQHEVIRHLRYCFRNDQPIPPEVERKALASYYALISLMDYHAGQLIDVINNSRLRDNTIIIYLSDHGEMAGRHGIWQKQCFYEDSVKIPMIIRMPGGQAGKRVAENVSLVDIAPTIMKLCGIALPDHLDGSCIVDREGDVPSKLQERTIFSEYHAQGMLTGGFMVKKGEFKLNYYVGHPPELYNVKDDPGERADLSRNSSYQSKVAEMQGELLAVANPEAVDATARKQQAKARKSLEEGKLR